MDMLFLLQFTCLIFMLVNVAILCIARLHVRWNNKHYERSRWMLVVGMLGLAMQYVAQMCFGLRASGDELGAVVNILVYTPCFTLISMAIYNIETTSTNRNKLGIVCLPNYALIVLAFVAGYLHSGSMYIGSWLYVMLALFSVNVACCIYMIGRELNRRKRMFEQLAANDMIPCVRYARTSILLVFITAFIMPFAILSTPLLYIIGPLGLIVMLLFTLTFAALDKNYVPTEELLNQEEDNKDVKADNVNPASDARQNAPQPSHSLLSEQEVQKIERKLDAWCEAQGYKDYSVNMLTLSRTLGVSRLELTMYFDQSLHSSFRVWLSDIRFKAAQNMMRQYPDYSNDIISAECGFSSRTHLYRIFKLREGCTPTEWREAHPLQNAGNAAGDA